MTIVDANLLLYAYDAESPHFRAAKKWFEQLMEGTDIIGIPWATIWAFLRIRTNPRLVAKPQEPLECFRIVREWLSLPGVVALEPGPRHIEILSSLVAEAGARGPLLSDAVMAALAIEQGGVLASTDRDFSRFPNLRWINPLDGKSLERKRP